MAKILTRKQRRALIAAAMMLIDEMFDDYKSVCDGEPIDETIVFAEYLPIQFRHYYNELFLKKFIICVIRIADRLVDWDEGEIPACTAECLALRAIIDRAKGLLEMKAEEEGAEPEDDFEPFVDVAFPDLDAELLFSQAMDGIEDTEAAKDMGMFIKPSQWFVPAYGSVHPYCS
jgi:hypothetical protein